MMNMNRPHQAPPPAEPNNNINNDEAFLNLLSSQQELLNQLNRETTDRKESKRGVVAGGPFGGEYSSNSYNAPAMMMGTYSNNSNERIYSNRFSLGLGTPFGDDSCFTNNSSSNNCSVTYNKLGSAPTFFSGPLMDANTGTTMCGEDGDFDFCVPCKDSNNKKHKRDNKECDVNLIDDTIMMCSFRKKRRLSGVGLFNSLSLFVDSVEGQQPPHPVQQPNRRLSSSSLSPPGDRLVPFSLDATTSPTTSGREGQDEEDCDDLLLVDPAPLRATFDDGVLPLLPPPQAVLPTLDGLTTGINNNNNFNNKTNNKKANKSKNLLLQGLVRGDPQTRTRMMILSSVMAKSQKSMQEIQDWDRSMGLKRSHSKTMRQSSRSRKKLVALLKKQINALAGNNATTISKTNAKKKTKVLKF